jgi:glycosyltransferase involved in cell wall biosynthesis
VISIVIPAFNEERFLPACLESLLFQKTTRMFEVVVVDNGSTDGTVAAAKRFTSSLNLRVITEPRRGRGAARRTGFRAAAGEVIFSTDADTVLPANWIETMMTKLETSTAIAVAGPARINDCSSLVNFIFNLVQPASAIGYRLIFGHYWLPGFNFAIRREVYFAAGEFNSSMDALEDTDLARRVRAYGRIAFVPSALVIFSGRRFKSGLAGGLASYVRAFVSYYFFGTRRIAWPNIR